MEKRFTGKQSRRFAYLLRTCVDFSLRPLALGAGCTVRERVEARSDVAVVLRSNYRVESCVKYKPEMGEKKNNQQIEQLTLGEPKP